MLKRTFKDFTARERRKRPKPALTGRWWRSAWPSETPPRPRDAGGMGLKIKAYHRAIRSNSLSDLIDSLEALQVAVENARKAARRGFTGFPQRKNAILDDLDELEHLIDDDISKSMKFGQKMRVVYKQDFGRAIHKIVKKEYGSYPKTRIPIKREILEVFAQETDENNALGMLQMQYSIAFENQAEKCGKALIELFDEWRDKKPAKTERLAVEILETHLGELEALHQKVPDKVIKSLSLNKEIVAIYRKKAKKRKAKIAINSAVLPLSVAAVFLPGAQPFAIYAAIRSAVGLSNQIHEHVRNISKKLKSLKKHLKALEISFIKIGKENKWAHGASETGFSASETGFSALEALIGAEIFPTIDGALADLEDIELESKYLYFKLQKLTDVLLKSVEKHEKFAEPIERIIQQVENDTREKPKNFVAMKVKLANSRKFVTHDLAHAHDLSMLLRDVEKTLPEIKDRLGKLRKNGTAQKIINKGVKGAVSLAGIAGGGLADAASSYEAVAKGVALGEDIAVATIASAGAAKEFAEESVHQIKKAKT